MLPGIGIFGTGEIVLALVPFLRAQGFKVEAIWGQRIIVVESLANELKIPYYTNKVDDVLLKKGVDLVFIICQPDLHAQIAVKALGIGKHVLCDRPAGLCQLEVLKMVNASQYYPLLISVISHGLRFHPAFVKAKKQLEAGYIGKLNVCDVRVQCSSLIGKQFDWMCSCLMGGGVLTLIGSHIIDIIYYMTSKRAIRVHGVKNTFRKTTDKINGIRWIDSDDFCSFQMSLENDAIFSCTINSHIQGPFSQEIVLCGSEGRLVIRDSNLYGYKVPNWTEEVLYDDNATLNVNLSDAALPKSYLQGLFLMISSLKEAFKSGDGEHGWLKEPVSNAATFEDGQYVQAVIDAIKLSSSSRQWEQVILTNKESDLNVLAEKLSLPNVNLGSLEALSHASTKISVSRRATHSDSHLLWGFASAKH